MNVCACACMCGKVVRKEGNGQTQGRDSIFSATTVPNLQSKPNLPNTVFYEDIASEHGSVGECAHVYV